MFTCYNNELIKLTQNKMPKNKKVEINAESDLSEAGNQAESDLSESENLDRYEISKQNGTVYVTDRHASSRHSVIPSCGQDALDCHEYLRSSMRHGKSRAQDFLGRIVAGDKPVTELCEEIVSHQNISSRNAFTQRSPR